MFESVTRFVRMSSLSSLMRVGSEVRTKKLLRYGSNIPLFWKLMDAMALRTMLCTSVWDRRRRTKALAATGPSLLGAI